MEEAALQAARVLCLDYAGVDLMRSEDGKTYVVEVNSIPGWRGLQKTTSQDIAGRIADYVMAELADRHE
jgi:glutathione synthase/RimK-type ligase-like ATP-grasp enzyme